MMVFRRFRCHGRYSYQTVNTGKWALPADERNALIYRQNSHQPLQEILHEGQRSYRKRAGKLS